MPNYAYNRLTLTGPADEVARFVRECVRVRRNESNDPPSLDLEALVPMPPEILATCDGATEEQRATARAATGFETWYAWSCAHWGTKWNICAFGGAVIDRTIYDCAFDTAWTCPEAALRALAARYPRLRGAVVASDPSSDWSLVAAFREGGYISVDGPFDRQLDLLVDGRYRSDTFGALSARAMISIPDDRDLFEHPDEVDPLWAQAMLAIEHLGRLVGGDLPRRLAFERMVVDVCDLLDADHSPDAAAAGWPAGVDHDVRFILAEGRTATPIDRTLMKILALDARDEATSNGGGWSSDGRHERIKHEIFDEFDDDDLCEWALLAMFRPGAVLDLRGEEALRGSILAYADRLRNDILMHACAADQDRALAAA